MAEQSEAVLYLRVSTKDQAERGGETEGFSIPAQRQAGYRKAEQLGALVVTEFVDAGESARSADRPELQKMLGYLREHPGVRYVIVHKVDRLARNRVDDVEINLVIRKAGASLVSCTENIDETPSGMLLHGIMSSIAEFYSRNLANEVIKGTEQKVRSGGTPTLAPLGYLNTREIVNGREIRTVVLDPERAELVAWAFEVYATGNWSLNRLAHELEVRGLTQRPTAKRSIRPLRPNKLQAVLRNRYYIGYVTWRGVEYEGRHPHLVDVETFQRVQAVLTAHAQSGERSYRRRQYLAGTLFCGRCGSRLIYAISTGRRGDRYAYWFCVGRHRHKNGCDLPYLAEERVERAVERQWQTETMSDTAAAELRDGLLDDLHDYGEQTEAETARLNGRLQAIQRERLKWAELAMSGAVPTDIARDKQKQLAMQLEVVQGQLASVATMQADHEQGIRIALRLVANCEQAYAESTDARRRAYNQAWFEGLYLDSVIDEVLIARAERTEVFEALRTAEQTSESGTMAAAPQDDEGRGSLRYRVLSHVGGSNVSTLVELRGIEPLTYSMRTSRATNCATAPVPLAGDAENPSSRLLARRTPVAGGGAVVEIQIVVLVIDERCARGERGWRGRAQAREGWALLLGGGRGGRGGRARPGRRQRRRRRRRGG